MANNKKYKAIVFDLGGVYFDNGLHKFDDLSREEGFKDNRFLYIIRKYFPKIETGKMSEHDFWMKYKHDVGFKAPIAHVKNIFLSNSPKKGMRTLVKSLRKNYKLALLTNNVSEWYERADKYYKISKDFDTVVVSADVGVRKPKKKIYKITADRLGVKLSDCLFFDDYMENIIGARRAGMDAYQARSTKDVSEKLLELGVVTKRSSKKKAKTKKKKVIPEKIIQFSINGKLFKTKPGTTVLKALGEYGFKIPTLCYAPIFPAKASCRVCLVEIKGARGLQTACSTEVLDGMEILTDTKKVQRARQTNLKLLYQDHIGKCPTCVRLKNCELLKLVSEYKAGAADFKGKERRVAVDKSGAVIFDMNKCIKCGRCIEACKKYGSDVLEMKKRGFSTVSGTKNGKKLKDSGCIGCKQCAQVCPVGAIYEK